MSPSSLIAFIGFTYFLSHPSVNLPSVYFIRSSLSLSVCCVNIWCQAICEPETTKATSYWGWGEVNELLFSGPKPSFQKSLFFHGFWKQNYICNLKKKTICEHMRHIYVYPLDQYGSLKINECLTSFVYTQRILDFFFSDFLLKPLCYCLFFPSANRSKTLMTCFIIVLSICCIICLPNTTLLYI